MLANRGHALALGGIGCCADRIGPSDRPDAKIGIPPSNWATCSRRSPSSSAARASRRHTSFAPPLGEIYNPTEAVCRFLDRLVPADEVEAAALKVAEDLVPLRYAFNTVKGMNDPRCSTAAAAASSTTSRSS